MLLVTVVASEGPPPRTRALPGASSGRHLPTPMHASRIYLDSSSDGMLAISPVAQAALHHADPTSSLSGDTSRSDSVSPRLVTVSCLLPPLLRRQRGRQRFRPRPCAGVPAPALQGSRQPGLRPPHACSRRLINPSEVNTPLEGPSLATTQSGSTTTWGPDLCHQ